MLPEFCVTRRIQFSETDMAGVVHFSNFFRMMEEVEHAFFRSRGLSVSMSFEGMEIGWPRVSASCDFSAPLRFEDEVELVFRVAKASGKTLSYEVEFLCRGRRVALGKTTSACCRITKDGIVAIAIPPTIRQQLLGETTTAPAAAP